VFSWWKYENSIYGNSRLCCSESGDPPARIISLSVAVVTAPDKPRGRGQQVSFTPVKECALKHSIPVLQPESLKDPQFISALQAIDADLFVIVAFRILPREVYTIPKKGSFNLHASLLPKFRGAAPINWAIITGEKESGVTTFFLQDKVDTGNIIMQARTPITNTMNAGELHDVLSQIGSEAVLKTVRMIEESTALPLPQDNTLATPAPKIFKETCRIDWNQPSEKVHNFIRGLSPYPAAWTMHRGKMIKIYTAKLSDVRSQMAGMRSGMVSATEKTLSIKTVDGTLDILEVQQEGKKRMGVEEFLRGYKFADGDIFE
jgi:methionyl-tRNA formyltransferase